MEQKSITEKKSDYNSRYPYNQVTSTSNGMIFEVDDTPGNIRYHFFHPSGSFFEYQHLGDSVNKIVGTKQEFIEKNSQKTVSGSDDTTIKGKFSQLVKGDSIYAFESSKKQIILKEYVLQIGSNSKTVIAGTRVDSIAKSYTLVANTLDFRAGTFKPSIKQFKSGSVILSGSNIETHSESDFYISAKTLNVKVNDFSLEGTTIFSGDVTVNGNFTVNN